MARDTATEISKCTSIAEETDAPGHCVEEIASASNLRSDDRVKTHPCYSEEAHHQYARIHVPVAPRCNIQCNYCNRRYDCLNESRPGVTSEVLTPEEAATRVGAVLDRIPQTTVLGIAGPGDPLANPEHTFKTFALVSQAYPALKMCLSTNGLMLPDYLDTIKEAKVEHVTITVNMIDPAVGKEIYDWVHYKGKTYRGEEGAALLSGKQLDGLKGLAERDVLCKVNIVMMPGINDSHIPQVVKEVKRLGACLVNIMPFIPVKDTKFQYRRGPTSVELRELRDECEVDIKQMRHCRQCRADAVGLLGEDRSSEFTKAQVLAAKPQVPVELDAATGAERKDGRKTYIAVASKGGGLVNQHFGHATDFMIYEASPGGVRFVEVRNVERYCEGPGACGEVEDRLDKIVQMLSDCRAVLCSRIGTEPAAALSRAGIDPILKYDSIENAIREVAGSL